MIKIEKSEDFLSDSIFRSESESSSLFFSCVIRNEKIQLKKLNINVDRILMKIKNNITQFKKIDEQLIDFTANT